MIPVIPSSASLKGIKDGLKPVNCERRPAATHSEESVRSAMPLITPFALQNVQLRSVKRPENGEADSSKSQETETDQMATSTWLSATFKKQEHPTALFLSSCNGPETNVFDTSSPEKFPTTNNAEERPTEQIQCLNDLINHTEVSANADIDGLERSWSTSAKSPQKTTPKKKPPVVSKKPKFSPVISPSAPESFAEEKQTLVNGEDATDFPNLKEEATICDSTEVQESSVEEQVRENDKSNTEMSESESSEPPTHNPNEETSQSAVTEEAPVDEAKGVSEGVTEDEEDDDEDGVSTGSVGSKDDENGESHISNFLLGVEGHLLKWLTENHKCFITLVFL